MPLKEKHTHMPLKETLMPLHILYRHYTAKGPENFGETHIIVKETQIPIKEL